MDEVSERIRALGKAIGDADRPDVKALARARRRWMAGEVPRAQWKVGRLGATFGVAAVVALAVGLWLGSGADVPSVDTAEVLSFTIDRASALGDAGQWIAANDNPVAVAFSDGTELRVARGARLRVSELGEVGAVLDLQRGRLSAVVVHRLVGAWTFRAGPYVAHVTGTRFEMAWDPVEEAFSLRMREGSVELTGPMLEGARSVVGGQVVRAWLGEARVEIRRATVEAGREVASAAPIAHAGAEVASDPAGGPPASSAPRAPSTAAGRRAQVRPREARGLRDEALEAGETPPPSAGASAAEGGARVDRLTGTGAGIPAQSVAPVAEWRRLLAMRAHGRALAAAEQAGFADVLRMATRDELYGLADAARFARRDSRARQALVALRTLHGERGSTAFMLGRIAAKRRRDHPEAVRWLEAYLRESPTGAFVEPALGRLMELHADPDPARARRLAARYIARFPSGSYAALARGLVDNP